MAVRKVLVVDDTPVAIKKLEEVISKAGIQVIAASSGTEAIRLAKSTTPDLIFMDIVMPDMDGFAACRQLKKDSATNMIPIVFVSSKDQKADRIWAQLQGGNAYITKPFSAEEILEQIRLF